MAENIIITNDPKILYKSKLGKTLQNPLILFRADKYGDTTISYFLERETDSMWKLKKGQSIPDYVVKNGQYLNYRVPQKPKNPVESQIKKNTRKLRELEDRISALEQENAGESIFDKKDDMECDPTGEIGRRAKERSIVAEQPDPVPTEIPNIPDKEIPIVEDDELDLSDVPL